MFVISIRVDAIMRFEFHIPVFGAKLH